MNLQNSILFIIALATQLATAAANAPTTAPAAVNLPAGLDPLWAIRNLAAARDRDPIGYLVMDMSDLTALLDRLNTRDPTQPDQQQVVARLDKLIAELEKACSGSGGGANPSRPLGDSRIVKGPGGQGPLHDPGTGTRNWGQLPPKQREQILQSQTEGFPPGFESILSSYYRRLAQENVGEGESGNDSQADGAAPATQPNSP